MDNAIMLGLNVPMLNIHARRDAVRVLVQGERVLLLCLQETKVVVFSNSMIFEPTAEGSGAGRLMVC